MTLFYSIAILDNIPYYPTALYSPRILQYSAVFDIIPTDLYNVLQHATILFQILQYVTVFFSILYHCMLLCNISQYSTVFYNTLQYSTIFLSYFTAFYNVHISQYSACDDCILQFSTMPKGAAAPNRHRTLAKSCWHVSRGEVDTCSHGCHAREDFQHSLAHSRKLAIFMRLRHSFGDPSLHALSRVVCVFWFVLVVVVAFVWLFVFVFVFVYVCLYSCSYLQLHLCSYSYSCS